MEENNKPKKPLSEFTDEELLQELKKRKQDSTFHAFAIGLFVGVAIFSVFRNGLGFLLVLLLLVILYLISQKKPSPKEVQDEIETRKSQ